MARWRRFALMFIVAHLSFVGLVWLFDAAPWPGGGPREWFVAQLIVVQCGEVAPVCFVEIGAAVRGATLLASALTAVILCAMYGVLMRRVGGRTVGELLRHPSS